MEKVTIEFLDVKKSPIDEIFQERILDWIEDGDRLTNLEKQYFDHYRKTICSTCTHKQQVKRKCAALSPYCDVKWCQHMVNANYRKHKELIIKHRNSHPMWSRLSIINNDDSA